MSPFRYQLATENGYGKYMIYQATPVIDRLSSLEEAGHFIYCAAR